MTSGILLNVTFSPVFYSSLYGRIIYPVRAVCHKFQPNRIVLVYMRYLFLQCIFVSCMISTWKKYTVNPQCIFFKVVQSGGSYSPTSMVYISSVLHTIRTTWWTIVLEVLLHLALKISCFWCEFFNYIIAVYFIDFMCHCILNYKITMYLI